MSKKSMILGIFLLILSATAFADQARWIKKSDAEKASEMIRQGTTIRRYCAPCGDSTWRDIPVNQMTIQPREKSFYEVTINGEGIDLAYIYIEKQGKWRNLAMLLSLNVSDVPESLSDEKERSRSAVAEQHENKENLHRIDKILDACITKESNTAGMTNCIHEAYELWDAELNRVYNSLKAMLNPAQKKALKQAQLQWIKYRDAEFDLIDSIYDSLRGTMFTPMRVGDRVDIVKKRTLELEAYLELMRLQ